MTSQLCTPLVQLALRDVLDRADQPATPIVYAQLGLRLVLTHRPIWSRAAELCPDGYPGLERMTHRPSNDRSSEWITGEILGLSHLPNDMRRGMNGLALQVQQALKRARGASRRWRLPPVTSASGPKSDSVDESAVALSPSEATIHSQRPS